MAKPPLGSGQRFEDLAKALSSKPGIANPAGMAASIGRKKYGAKKFNGLAAAGKKNAKI